MRLALTRQVVLLPRYATSHDPLESGLWPEGPTNCVGHSGSTKAAWTDTNLSRRRVRAVAQEHTAQRTRPAAPAHPTHIATLPGSLQLGPFYHCPSLAPPEADLGPGGWGHPPTRQDTTPPRRARRLHPPHTHTCSSIVDDAGAGAGLGSRQAKEALWQSTATTAGASTRTWSGSTTTTGSSSLAAARSSPVWAAAGKGRCGGGGGAGPRCWWRAGALPPFSCTARGRSSASTRPRPWRGGAASILGAATTP